MSSVAASQGESRQLRLGLLWRGSLRHVMVWQLRRVAFRYVSVGFGKAVKVRQGKVTLVSFGRGELGLKKEKR